MKRLIPLLFALISVAILLLAYLDMHTPSRQETLSSSNAQTESPADIIDRELSLQPAKPESREGAQETKNSPDEANALEEIEAESGGIRERKAEQRHIFDAFRRLLLETAPYRGKIYLNTPISDVLKTPQQKERFVRVLEKRWHYTPEEAQKALREKRIVWDWVQTLTERGE